MKYDKIKAMSEEEKNNLMTELKMKLLKLNLQVSTGTTLKKPKEIREIKKDIARILTTFNEQKGGLNTKT
jgi:ribosomal protein L29